MTSPAYGGKELRSHVISPHVSEQISNRKVIAVSISDKSVRGVPIILIKTTKSYFFSFPTILLRRATVNYGKLGKERHASMLQGLLLDGACSAMIGGGEGAGEFKDYRNRLHNATAIISQLKGGRGVMKSDEIGLFLLSCFFVLFVQLCFIR